MAGLGLGKGRHKVSLMLLAHLNAQIPCYRFRHPSHCVENAKGKARRVSSISSPGEQTNSEERMC